MSSFSRTAHQLLTSFEGCITRLQFELPVSECTCTWDTSCHCCQHCKNKLQKISIWARDAEVAPVTTLRAETSRHLVNYDYDSPLGTDVVPRSTSWWWTWEEPRQNQLVTDNKQSVWTVTKMKLYFCWCHNSVIMLMTTEAPGSKSFSLVYASSLWETKYFFDKLAKRVGHNGLWMGRIAETRSVLHHHGLDPCTRPPAQSHGEDMGTQGHKPFPWNCGNKNINEAAAHLQFKWPSNLPNPKEADLFV